MLNRKHDPSVHGAEPEPGPSNPPPAPSSPPPAPSSSEAGSSGAVPRIFDLISIIDGGRSDEEEEEEPSNHSFEYGAEPDAGAATEGEADTVAESGGRRCEVRLRKLRPQSNHAFEYRAEPDTGAAAEGEADMAAEGRRDLFSDSEEEAELENGEEGDQSANQILIETDEEDIEVLSEQINVQIVKENLNKGKGEAAARGRLRVEESQGKTLG